MGAPMATNLAAAGFDVHYFDPFVSDASIEALTAAGARRVTHMTGLGSADISFSMLPDAAVTREALFGGAALLEQVGPGHLHVAMGTIGSAAARELGVSCSQRGVRFADAPVSGSTETATSRGLTTFVGAAAEDFQLVLPYLRAMTRSQIHMGGVGAGSAMKLSVNLIVAEVNQAMAEALVFAERSGIPRSAAYDAISASVAATPYAAYKRAVFLDPDGEPVSAPMSILHKDLALTSAEAAAFGLELPGVEAARSVILTAIEDGLIGADIGAVIRVIDGTALTSSQSHPQGKASG